MNENRDFGKCSPQQMFDNPDLERDYIFDQLDKRDKQQNIKDLHLMSGSFVRYIIPRANGRKKRYQYSRECYKIANVNGNMYTLIARDCRDSNYRYVVKMAINLKI